MQCIQEASPVLQELLPIATPTLEEPQEEYIWMTYTVLEVSHDSLTVDTEELEYTTVTTLMMLD